MGDTDMVVASAFTSWDRELNARAGAQHPPKVERQCAHLKEGSDGYLTEGELYLKALQRLKGSAASGPARKAEPFFWSGARKVRVWLMLRLCGRGGREVNRLAVSRPGHRKASRPIT